MSFLLLLLLHFLCFLYCPLCRSPVSLPARLCLWMFGLSILLWAAFWLNKMLFFLLFSYFLSSCICIQIFRLFCEHMFLTLFGVWWEQQAPHMKSILKLQNLSSSYLTSTAINTGEKKPFIWTLSIKMTSASILREWMCNCGEAAIILHFWDVYLSPDIWLKSPAVYFYWRDYDQALEDVSLRFVTHSSSRWSPRFSTGKLQLHSHSFSPHEWASFSHMHYHTDMMMGFLLSGAPCTTLCLSAQTLQNQKKVVQIIGAVFLLRSNLPIKAWQ